MADRNVVYKDRECVVRYAITANGKPLMIIARELVRCKDCKHNPKLEWFGCPMAGLSEKQRPETAWCWKGERKGERKDGDRDEP